MNLNVPIEKLRKETVYIATPMYGGMCYGTYTKSLLSLTTTCHNHGVPLNFGFVMNESLITRARNYLVDEFLRSKATYLMFIDSDIDFDPRHVLTLLAIAVEKDMKIIGAPYPKKTIAWENIYDAVRYGFVPNDNRGELGKFAGDFVINMVPGQTTFKLDEPVEVLEIGTGFMMIHRSVFEDFAKAYPDYTYLPDHNRSAAFDGSRNIFQYFQAEIDPKTRRYLSEDYWFCQKARDAGIPVWLCPWLELSHHGTHVYQGTMPALAAVRNERQKRNEPEPATISATVSTAEGTKNENVSATARGMSLRQFYSLSATLRKKFFKELAAQYDIDVAILQDHYTKHRDSWLSNAEMSNATIEEIIASAIPALTATEV